MHISVQQAVRIRARIWRAAGAAALIVSASLPVHATSRPKAPPNSTQIQRGSYNDPYFGTQNGRICARWCLEDRNPCDPPNFKIADGRCRFLDD